MKLHHNLRILALVGTLGMASTPGLAQNDNLGSTGPCSLELTADNSVDWRGTFGRGYEVFEDTESFETVNVAVRHSGEACQFYLTATASSGGGQNALLGSGDSLFYDLLKTTSGPSFLSEDYFGTQTSRIDGQFGNGRGTQGATLYVSLPANQFVRGGKYSGQALIRLFRVSDGGPELVAETPIVIVAPVASVLKVRSDQFPQGSRESSIDLGDLSTEARRSFDFNIKSNAEVAVTFQSANQGQLSHQFGAPGIKYQLAFRGENIDLTASSASSRISPALSREEFQIPVEITVPTPRGMPAAGQYSDRLTVTFTAE